MKTLPVPLMVVLAVVSSQAARLSTRMFSGTCDVIPADGCSCHQSYRGMDVSCHDLALTAMPPFSSAGRDISLETVHVTGNSIASLDQRAFRNVQIRKLYLKNNQLSGIDTGALSSSSDTLIHIDLSYNQLTEIPKALQDLNVLKTIVLTHNDIASIGCDILATIPHNSLYIDENPLEEIAACSEWPSPSPDLRKLVISLDHVDNIEYSSDPFSVLPYVFTVNLRVFVLRKTKLSAVDMGYMEFDAVEFIGLEEAGLEDSAINNAVAFRDVANNLLGLSLPGNELTVIPKSALESMVNLELLDLSRNKITSIRSQMTYLSKLKNLDLSGNTISFISSGVLQLPSLEILDLSNNVLGGLASDAISVSSLLSFSIQGNPWQCGCNLKWLIEQVQEDAYEGEGPFISAEMFGKGNGDRLRCAGDNQFTDVLLVDVDLADLQC